MSLPRLIALGIVTAFLLAAASASSAGLLQNCGSGVRAAMVSCAKAKRIAAEYRKTHHRSIWQYTCSKGRSQARCVLDQKIVTFSLE
jgi:hypothetical protein